MRRLSFASAPAAGPRRKGSALLETALALAVFAPLAVTAARYAWGFYQFQSLHSIVEESARFAASASMSDGDEAWKASVRQYALCGSAAPCEHPRLELRPDNIQVDYLQPQGLPAAVRVAIQGYTIAVPGGEKRFQGTPAAQFPRIESAR